ncbi:MULTISPECIES: phosphonate ABC transporter ATP-binding protein [unclassified Enterococcus]|uniref:phosphonate ABC transporter ATP-binding protein n=1 Tax=unclassified Enterococcus TaxID=2608891 RepID=UPI001A9B3D46|nr:phosphonate ABC transporter ATP-binding protein [Enterococcus sp. DIV1271a]MBO1300058.1 phosphonate ABC transporter ATP-binding protein [Enterococcus sp. DIV1271a]
MPAKLLEIKQLSKTYDKKKYALSEIDLTVEEGEFIVVIGPSGAGKSTFIRTINRMIEPSRGEVLFAGMDVTRAKKKQLKQIRSEIGMIFQHYNLIGRTNVIKNVLHGRLGKTPFRKTIFGLYSEKDKQEAVDLLSKVGLKDHMYQRASALSGGQMQRVGICRAIMQQPKLILADEPIASLDPNSAKVVMEHLQGITHERQITCIINLHQVDFAKKYATRILGIKDGRIVFDGPPQDLSEAIIAHIYQGKEEQKTLSEEAIPVLKEKLSYGEA